MKFAKNVPSILLKPPWLEPGIPLLLYFVLTIGLTWPMIPHFTSTIPSDGGDAKHNVWLIWHVYQAVLGREPLLYAPHLYYPAGVPLLVHGVGPVMGFLALPFWPWGHVAAYNGAILLAFVLTGGAMYWLARQLGFARDVAFFAGVVLLVADMRLIAIIGHLEKTFLGLIPLALGAWLHSLNHHRSRWWTVATAGLLLLLLLHSGWQFALTALGMMYFGVVAWLAARPGERIGLLRRSLLFSLSAAVIVGPLLLAVARAGEDPAFDVDKHLDSASYQPDGLEFWLPAQTSRLLGDFTNRTLASYKIKSGIESRVSLAWTCLALGLVALARGGPGRRRWLLFLVLCVLCAAGPSLKFLNERLFTDYKLPIMLPYALVTQLPGLEFMRTPGRFMLIGYVGLAVVACYGLTWLKGRVGQRAWLVPALALGLLLVETWPRPWPEETLPPASRFYQELGRDPEMYGVFDLPLRPTAETWHIGYSARYMLDQMTHRKGIATGYLSRNYQKHPVVPCLIDALWMGDIQVNGRAVGCWANAQYELAAAGYRYVVWHKTDSSGRSPSVAYAQETTRALLQTAYGPQLPIIDDDEVTVYAVPPETPPLQVSMELKDGWYHNEGNQRWAMSPATVRIVSPQRQTVVLNFMPASLHIPGSQTGVGSIGLLRVQLEDREPSYIAISTDRMASVRLRLRSGEQTVSLSLEAGNFRPADYGQSEQRPHSFAVRWMNLEAP